MPGCGTTHLSIALANYVTSKYGFRAACLEFNSSGAFSQLSTCTAMPFYRDTLPVQRHFTIYGVDYYPLVDKQEIPVLMNAGYHYLIFDFGTISTDTFDELLRCDRKLILGSLAPWKDVPLYDFCRKYPKEKQQTYFLFLVLFGEKQDIQTFSKKCTLSQRQVLSIPFIQNPFHITKEQFTFLEKLL